MIDNYSHVENNLYYITESIPGPKEFSPEYNLLIDAFNSQITHHCACLSCSLQCPCVTMYSNKTIKIKDFEPVTSFMECNDNCSCSSDCKNRTVQKGPIKNLYVKKCDKDLKGYGLFCEQVIKKGTFICEYAGEILTKSEAARRHSLNTLHNKMNYIFGLKEVVNEKIIETFIDPCTFGNIGRYINHSCEPNSSIVPVRINCMIPKLAIFSCSCIEPHSEITFNYSANNNNLPLQLNVNRKKCLCNSSICLGHLPFDP